MDHARPECERVERCSAVEVVLEQKDAVARPADEKVKHVVGSVP
jgi:hypothetical protein